MRIWYNFQKQLVGKHAYEEFFVILPFPRLVYKVKCEISFAILGSLSSQRQLLHLQHLPFLLFIVISPLLAISEVLTLREVGFLENYPHMWSKWPHLYAQKNPGVFSSLQFTAFNFERLVVWFSNVCQCYNSSNIGFFNPSSNSMYNDKILILTRH